MLSRILAALATYAVTFLATNLAIRYRWHLQATATCQTCSTGHASQRVGRLAVCKICRYRFQVAAYLTP